MITFINSFKSCCTIIFYKLFKNITVIINTGITNKIPCISINDLGVSVTVLIGACNGWAGEGGLLHCLGGVTELGFGAVLGGGVLGGGPNRTKALYLGVGRCKFLPSDTNWLLACIGTGELVLTEL